MQAESRGFASEADFKPSFEDRCVENNQHYVFGVVEPRLIENIFDEGNDDLLGEENVDDGGHEPTTPPKSDGSDREQSSKRPRDIAEETLMPGPGDPDDDQDGGYVLGLEGNMLYQHECHGHWPYDKGCDACVQARGRTLARSRKHEENQELLD